MELTTTSSPFSAPVIGTGIRTRIVSPGISTPVYFAVLVSATTWAHPVSTGITTRLALVAILSRGSLITPIIVVKTTVLKSPIATSVARIG